MPTNLAIDDELIAEAVKLSNTYKKNELNIKD